ncbi:unnamed protein product, partial [Meganyctiphanes norvegica]
MSTNILHILDNTVESFTEMNRQCSSTQFDKKYKNRMKNELSGFFFSQKCKPSTPKNKIFSPSVNSNLQKNSIVAYCLAALQKNMFHQRYAYIYATFMTSFKTSLFLLIYIIGVTNIRCFSNSVKMFKTLSLKHRCINLGNPRTQGVSPNHVRISEEIVYGEQGFKCGFFKINLNILVASINLGQHMTSHYNIHGSGTLAHKKMDIVFGKHINLNVYDACFTQTIIKLGHTVHLCISMYINTSMYTLFYIVEKNITSLNNIDIVFFKRPILPLTNTQYSPHKKNSTENNNLSPFAATVGFVRTNFSEICTHTGNLSSGQVYLGCLMRKSLVRSACVIDAALIMHQLTCNGVLEGIRICRKGFPNRIAYADFKHRYKILASQELTNIPDNKEAATACFEKVGLDAEKWRVGHTKVFFRAGVLGELEEIRDDALGQAIGHLQAWIRGHQSRKKFQKMKEQREMLIIVQRTLRRYMKLRNWPWYLLWQDMKPLLNASRAEDEMKALAAKAAAAEKKLDDQNAKILALEAQNLTLMNQRNDLQHTLESTKSGFSSFMDKEKKLVAKTKELETQLEERIERLAAEEEARNVLFTAKQKVEQEVKNMRSSLEDFELNVQRCEQDKATKDHQIRNLTEETSHQDELINKLQKEKKHLQEANQKTAEDLQSVEDKCNHLSMLKSKLEQTLDELEDSLDREKKLRAEVDMAKRKISSDLKLTQDAVGDVEREKKEMENIILRSEKDISQYQAKIDDQSCQISKLQRQIKEQQTVIEEFEGDLVREKEARGKTEKSKQRIAKDLQEMSDRLDEAGGATAAQIELNKKRESELAKLRRDLEEHSIQHEAAIVSFRKKHNDSVAELAEQIDHLNKIKVRAEKDRDASKREAEDARAALDQVMKDKVIVEKVIKENQRHMDDLQIRMDEANRTLNDFDVCKKQLTCENGDLLRKLDDSENKNSMLSKNKLSLENQLQDTKKLADDECREHA